jgi:hypothetical protein
MIWPTASAKARPCSASKLFAIWRAERGQGPDERCGRDHTLRGQFIYGYGDELDREHVQRKLDWLATLGGHVAFRPAAYPSRKAATEAAREQPGRDWNFPPKPSS